ncbi:MAG: hypothetical protein L3J43_02645 [Sulfurovum sp.]|nr:hypothetical protein [Sulfurovum sp.]
MNLKIIIGKILIFFMLGQTLMAEEIIFVSQRDKQKHAVVSAVVAFTVTGFARNRGASKVESFFYGAGAAIALGILKEGLDGHNDDSTREWADIGADVIGATAGALISAQFEWKF